MEHEDYKAIIDKYIEGLATAEEKEILEKHMSDCADCRAEVDEISFIRQSLNSLEHVTLPENFASSLHDKLLEIKNEKPKEKENYKSWWSRFRLIYDFYRANKKVLAAGFAVFIVGILVFQLFQGSPGYDFMSKAEKNQTAEPQYMVMDEGFLPERAMQNDGAGAAAQENYLMKSSMDLKMSSQAIQAPQERKIIKEASLTIYVENFEEQLEFTLNLPEKIGGYIENSNIYGSKAERSRRSASIAIRIPEAELENVLNELRNLGRIESENITGQDITQSYYDTDARVNNLRQQETRLLEILKMANNVDEILKIENELNRVRTEIDQLTGQLQTWDNMIRLSLVQVHLIEEEPFREKVVPVTFQTLWKKAKEGFISTSNNIMEAMAELARLAGAAFPFLAPVVIVILLVIAKRRRGKS